MSKSLLQQALASAAPDRAGLLHSPKAKLAFMLVVLALTWLLTQNAASDLRGGDEGSGIGGTGRLPGGIGGTGLRPFITQQTLDQTIEVTVRQQARAAAANEIGADVDAVIARQTLPPRATGLTHTKSIEGFTLPRSQASATLGSQANDTTSVSIDEYIASTLSDNNSLLAHNAATLAIAPDTASAPAAETNDTLNWSDLSDWLAQRQRAEKSAESAAEESSVTPDAATVSLLQRPQLPPLQRARPIQRAALLPPRIRPLKL